MKKIIVIPFILGMLLPITSCDFLSGGEKEETSKVTVKGLKILGTPSKKHYGYDEQWDISSVSACLEYSNGTTKALTSSDYVLSTNPAYPKDYINSLTIIAKETNGGTYTGSRIFYDFSVDSPTYDLKSELTDYYDGYDLTKSGNSLLNVLHKQAFDKHTKWITYKEVSSYYTRTLTHESIDLIPNKSKKELIYTGTPSSYYVGNKEHIWAAADSSNLWSHSGGLDNDGYYGGGSDLLHVRPCDSKVNTARGDAPFVDFDDTEHSSKKSNVVEVGDKEGPYTLRTYGGSNNNGVVEFADYVEVDDSMKGDIARIIAYVYMHYSSSFSGTPSKYNSIVGSLSLTNALGYSASRCKAKLIEWNNLDPVSDVEKYRNHTVMCIQGNRNPFVDYPELMAEAFN